MSFQSRLDEAASRAKAAEDRADERTVSREWRRYRLIRDGARDPEELIAEGVALSAHALEIAATVR
jgi:hypothetical protein